MHPARHAQFRTNGSVSTTGMQEQTPIAEKYITSLGDNEVKGSFCYYTYGLRRF